MDPEPTERAFHINANAFEDRAKSTQLDILSETPYPTVIQVVNPVQTGNRAPWRNSM